VPHQRGHGALNPAQIQTPMRDSEQPDPAADGPRPAGRPARPASPTRRASAGVLALVIAVAAHAAGGPAASAEPPGTDGAPGAGRGTTIGGQTPIPPETLRRVQSLMQEAEARRGRGDGPGAIRLWGQVVTLTEQLLGPEHTNTAISLHNLAVVHHQYGALKDAEPLYRRALGIHQRVSGAGHPLTVGTLRQLLALYTKHGEVRKAEETRQRLKEAGVNPQPPGGSPAGERPGGPNPLLDLFREAEALEARGDRVGAAERWQRILALSTRTAGPDSPGSQAAISKLTLYGIQSVQERQVEAGPLLERTLQSLEQALGADHIALAIPLDLLGALARQQGHTAEAGRHARRSVAIRERVQGMEHADTIRSLDLLADIHRLDGRLEDAESLTRRVLRIRETSLGRAHPLVAKARNDLGVILNAQARYTEAEAMYRSALAILESVPGQTHEALTASVAGNLAVLLDDLGRSAEAEALHRQVLAIRERVLGADHADTALSLNNLAALVDRQGRAPEAERLYRRALSAAERQLGPAHPQVAATLSNLAGVLGLQGRQAEAEALLRRALRIREQALGLQHPATANSLHGLGLLFFWQGRDREAEPLLQRALAITETMAGPEHPSTSSSLMNLAAVHLRLGRPSAAEPLLRRLTRNQSEWLRRELPLQPRDLRAGLLAQQPDAVATTFLLLERDPAAVELALETRLNRQGLLAEIERRQRLLAASADPSRQLAERIAALDRRLAAVTLDPGQRQQLRQQRQALENELNRQLPALRIEAVSVTEVASGLRRVAPQGVLVEFQRYRLLQPAAAGGGWGPARYVALVLHADGRMASVGLGDAEAIDAVIGRALAASAANYQDAPELWGQVADRVLRPLAAQLAGVQELFLVPDGELNRVPFAVLPEPGGAGRLLAERLPLRILTTGRELLRPEPAAGSGAAAVVIADPSYGSRRGGGARGAAAAAGGGGGSAGEPQRRSAGLGPGTRWQPLPGTAREARLVAPLVGAGEPITGSAATAERVLRQRGPRILHIATHGYFQPDAALASAASPDPLGHRGGGLAGAGGLAASRSGTTAAMEDPLLRSGLALAGANEPEADAADDGYLTAAEATGMDLEGTELVTLSACETGLGALRSGEGVYGLQRALTVAGSRATLLSLWKVDDAATAAFMGEYYGRLRRGEGRGEALAGTQALFREHPNPLYRDVHVWGAFQLTGDWRPLAAASSGR